MINALNIFVVGHAMSQVGTAELSRRGSPGAAAASARLDVSDLPLVTEAARRSQGVDEEARFLFGLDALLCGFARWKERDQGRPDPGRPPGRGMAAGQGSGLPQVTVWSRAAGCGGGPGPGRQGR